MAVTTLLYSSTVETNYSDTISFAFLLCCGNDCFLYTPVKHHIEKQKFKPQSSIFLDDFLCPSPESSVQGLKAFHRVSMWQDCRSCLACQAAAH